MQLTVELAAVISTDELVRRPSREPDHAAENAALVVLAEQIAAQPRTILEALTGAALTLTAAHSAGISLLDKDGIRFFWPAIAGRWAEHVGGGTPREFGPCGTVLDRDQPILFSHPERYFPYLSSAAAPIDEALLTPFYVDGEAVGTVWVISHNSTKRFDREDLRLLTVLGRLAGACYRTVQSLSVSTEAGNRLAHELTDAHRLQRISTELIREGDSYLLYEHLLNAAIAVVHADMAMLQLLDESGRELRLLASQGVPPATAAIWAVVHGDSPSAYGTALRTGKRSVVEDVETSAALAGTADLGAFRDAGIRAVQSTPLVSRSGRVLGILSTQWRRPQVPPVQDLQLLDVLARQAADAIERMQAEEELRHRTVQVRALLDNAPLGVCLVDQDFRIREVNPAARQVFGNIPNLIGRPLDDVIHRVRPQSRADDLVERFRRTLATGEPQVVSDSPDSASTRYEWTLQRVPLADGRLGVGCYLRDISAL